MFVVPFDWRMNMNEWQPIETAPKDGDWKVVARFDRAELRWWERARWNTKWSQWRTHGGVAEPTHWLPFPDPPVVPVEMSGAHKLAVELAEEFRRRGQYGG